MNPESSNRPLASTEANDSASPTARFSWLAFVTALVFPTLLTMLMTLLVADKGDAAPATAFVGSMIGGIFSGTMLGRWIGKTSTAKILLTVVFAAIAFIVCLAMSCCGCIVGGYKLNIH